MPEVGTLEIYDFFWKSVKFDTFDEDFAKSIPLDLEIRCPQKSDIFKADLLISTTPEKDYEESLRTLNEIIWKGGCR